MPFNRNVLDSHQQRKQKRIREFEKLIEERGTTDYRKFIAEMQYLGLRKKVAEEYIEALVDLEKIKINNGKIIYTGTE